MSHPTASWTLVPASAYTSSTLAGAAIFPGVDIALDADGDLDISTGDARLTTPGLEATAQGIWIRLKMVRGEWFLNRETGIPYLANDIVSSTDALLGGKFSELKTRAAFRKAIEEAPGVVSIDSLEVTFVTATRELKVSFKVTATDGTIEGSI